MKIAKPVITLEIYSGSKSCCMTERRKSLDEDHKPYVRAKRNSTHLPDSWDTKWIKVKEFRNWKRRCKKQHQWEKHKQTPEEIKTVTGKYPDEYILYIYAQIKWVRIDTFHKEDVERLIEEGKLQAGYITCWYWRARKYNEETHEYEDIYPIKVYRTELRYAKLP